MLQQKKKLKQYLKNIFFLEMYIRMFFTCHMSWKFCERKNICSIVGKRENNISWKVISWHRFFFVHKSQKISFLHEPLCVSIQLLRKSNLSVRLLMLKLKKSTKTIANEDVGPNNIHSYITLCSGKIFWLLMFCRRSLWILASYWS